NKPVIYSDRSCPYGCSLSASLKAALKPNKVNKEDAESPKLFIPSVIIEIMPDIVSASHLIPNNTKLEIKPTLPDKIPNLARASPLACLLKKRSINPLNIMRLTFHNVNIHYIKSQFPFKRIIKFQPK